VIYVWVNHIQSLPVLFDLIPHYTNAEYVCLPLTDVEFDIDRATQLTQFMRLS